MFIVVHLSLMSTTLTIRLPEDLAEWVEKKTAATGRSRGSLVKEALERVRRAEHQPFMKLAGAVEGASDLSSRRGFSRK